MDQSIYVLSQPMSKNCSICGKFGTKLWTAVIMYTCKAGAHIYMFLTNGSRNVAKISKISRSIVMNFLQNDTQPCLYEEVNRNSTYIMLLSGCLQTIIPWQQWEERRLLNCVFICLHKEFLAWSRLTLPTWIIVLHKTRITCVHKGKKKDRYNPCPSLCFRVKTRNKLRTHSCLHNVQYKVKITRSVTCVAATVRCQFVREQCTRNKGAEHPLRAVL